MPLPFKSGYEAIEFAVKKWLMKNRPIQGLSTIPGKRGPFDVDQIQKTINTLADTFRKSGKDVNKVTVQDADRLINYEQALKAQKAKKPDFASGGIARVGMLMGGFTKAQVLIQMMKNTLKGSKDAYVKKTFPNMIKELTKNPELAKDPKVWNFFTNKLPKNQRLVVHSDDSVDFWKQSDFGPHNIETTNKFMKKHNLSRDEAVRIQNMQPEDQILEMKRLETIRNRTKQASGGIAGELHLHRPGYKGGALVKLLNLLKGKKKNVWRGFETDYKNILRGDWYPEEFSGRFFTPDKDLAKWYAMRQGTLTGKVKKLKLTEEEIKAAQEFAEKNLDIQYGKDLLVSKELAEKAKVDLPATALAKIEAVIRKAKGTKRAKKHRQKDFAEGGIAGQLNRPGYAGGIGPVGEGMYNPVGEGDWLLNMPQMDPELRKLMEEYKKRKGLAEILGV